MSGPDIIVVGAGIVGASIAYHLAKAGARVTVVESRPRAGAGVTGRSFGWINLVNAPMDEADAAFDLRQRGVSEFRRLDAELGGALNVDWRGGLVWRADTADTEALAAYHEARGVSVSRLDRASILAAEPRLATPPALAIYSEHEGAVDPAAAAETLLRAAWELGAARRMATRIDGLATQGGRVTGVRVGRWTLGADAVVLATGTETGRLAATVDIDLAIRASKAVLLTLNGPSDLIRHVVSCPDIEIRQGPGTTLFCADDHTSMASADHAVEAAATARRFFTGADDISPVSGRIGDRPVPADGLPVIGAHPKAPGLFIAVMHPGVILAPLAGRWAAEELVLGRELAELASLRPDRESLAGHRAKTDEGRT